MAKSKRKNDTEKLFNRTNKMQQDLNNLTTKVNGLEKQWNQFSVAQLLEDLQKETFPGSGRYLYTYADLANKYSVSPSTVGRIAEDNGINRRKRNNA